MNFTILNAYATDLSRKIISVGNQAGKEMEVDKLCSPISSGLENCRRPVGLLLNFPLPIVKRAAPVQLYKGSNPTMFGSFCLIWKQWQYALLCGGFQFDKGEEKGFTFISNLFDFENPSWLFDKRIQNIANYYENCKCKAKPFGVPWEFGERDGEKGTSNLFPWIRFISQRKNKHTHTHINIYGKF